MSICFENTGVSGPQCEVSVFKSMPEPPHSSRKTPEGRNQLINDVYIAGYTSWVHKLFFRHLTQGPLSPPPLGLKYGCFLAIHHPITSPPSSLLLYRLFALALKATILKAKNIVCASLYMTYS
jgi:hypothetical protein